MRLLLTLGGTAVIVAYAMFGAVLVNDWGVVASSGFPLETTISDMHEANQPYSTVPGIIFAVVGVLLALAWFVATLHPRIPLPIWASILAWAGIIMFGAPAFFFASFGNLNSVGDTYVNWNVGAANIIAIPLYILSAASFVGAIATVCVLAISTQRGRRVT